MNPMIVGLLLPWIIVCFGCWLGFQLVRQNGRILVRLEALEGRLGRSGADTMAPTPAPPPGLPIGSLAPEFDLPSLTGVRTTLAQFRGQELLVIFFNPRCGFCSQMTDDLAALPAGGAGGRPLPLIISTGDADENRRFFREQNINGTVLLQQEMEVATRYQAHGTPMGYRIDAYGNIACELAIGAEATLALATAPAANAVKVEANGNGHHAHRGNRDIADSKINREGLPTGTQAPDFTLPTLDGGELTLQAYRDRPILLVFSDPNCGPCAQLAPSLEQHHRRAAEIRILMISRGDMAANRTKAREQGLTFPIGLQKGWEISRQYAMFATPIAYLIDEEGVIAAEGASGSDAILDLLNHAAPVRDAQVPCRCGEAATECGCRRKKMALRR